MNRCVSIFVLFALVATAMGGWNREKFQADKQKCIEELGIEPELVKGPPPKDGPVDEKFKCFAACMMQQRGGLKEDGSFDLAEAIARVPDDMPNREKVVSALTECADKASDNKCESAHQIMKCMHEKMPRRRHD